MHPIVVIGWFIFSIVAQIVFIYLIIEKLWPAILMIRSILAPYFAHDTQSLKNKYGAWAVVTGATDGIGKAYAFELARQNLNVVLISRNPDKLLATAAEIEAKYPIKTKIISADFSNGNAEFYANIAKLLHDIPIGILVNNVGINYTYPVQVEELPASDAINLLNINMGATVMMSHIILPIMKKNKRGIIVNVSSGAENQPLPYMALYAASKAFVKNFSDAIRFECSNHGVTVQTLSPFFVNTKINDFSARLRETSLLVPDAETYARHAVATLGKTNHTTGYWPHGLQYTISSLAPYPIRTMIAGYMMKFVRKEYLQQQNSKKESTKL